MRAGVGRPLAVSAAHSTSCSLGPVAPRFVDYRVLFRVGEVERMRVGGNHACSACEHLHPDLRAKLDGNISRHVFCLLHRLYSFALQG